MKKLILLLPLTLVLVKVFGNCYEFELKYIPILHDISAIEELDAFDGSSGCDVRMFYASQMVRAFKRNEANRANHFFGEVVKVIGKLPKQDSTSLKIVYVYASFLEMEGKSLVASTYYSYVKHNSDPESILGLLSKTSIIGIKNSTEGIQDWKKELLSILTSGAYQNSDIATILIKVKNYLDSEESSEFLSNFSNLLTKKIDPELKYVFLSHLTYIYAEQKKEGFYSFFERSDKIFKALKKEKFLSDHLALKAKVLVARKNYDEALTSSTKSIDILLADYQSVEEIFADPPAYQPRIYSQLERHGAVNLFQTRTGKGITPVIKSFNLFELNQVQKFKSSLEFVNDLVLEKQNYNHSYTVNILIIGFYLYQKTGDISYLNRSVQVLDRWTGAGSFYWSVVRDLSRKDTSKGNRFLATQKEINHLLVLQPRLSLQDIFNREQQLEEKRAEMSGIYPNLLPLLEEKSTIDLPALSQELASDSSAILCFYTAKEALYRLLVTPDTIDMVDIYQRRPKALQLTEQLQALSNPEGKKETNADASRELYTLLFSGIDSLLPSNVHIIATGELEHVPFPALRREAPGQPARYLGAEVAISRQMSISSMRMLRDQERTPSKERPLGLAPAFANESLQVADLRQAGFVLPPLFYNTEELKNLEARGPGAYFYGEDATLSNYHNNVTNYSIIHLATHAISSEIDGLRSRIYLAGKGDETAELFTSDIGDQTLNADLVVLSACETSSGGRHVTEGRISLTKAYLAAGARSVVSSNWAVDDFATAALMEGFYQHIQDGKPPHQALQLSRKAYLDKYPKAPPYKWAAFEAYGGMKAVAWDRSRSIWPAIGYGSLALISLGLATAYVRRRRNAQLRA